MSAAELLRAVAYVDGGCVPNPGRSGGAAVLVTGEETRELLGRENSTSHAGNPGDERAHELAMWAIEGGAF